jgi:general stress protein 26
MNRMKFVGMAVLAVMLGHQWPSAAAQPAAPPPPDRTAILNAAAHVMKEARYCALITVDGNGHPQARAVDAFPAEDNFVVWIATKAGTRKLSEIKRNPHVTLYYWDPKDPGYVSLAGTAEIVTAPEEKAKRWKEEWKEFYSDRNRGSDYVLIRVAPLRVEAVSYGLKVLNDEKTWQVPAVSFPVKAKGRD